jgi:polysaccharide biosynthesis protein PslJ
MTEVGRPELRRPELPAWPLGVLLIGYPVWWALGFSWLAVVGSALIMTALLVVRRTVELPPGSWLWGTFLLFATCAATEIDGGLRLAGFGVRLSNYVGSGVVLLYVYNARRALPIQRIFTYLLWYFAAVGAGGWLGVLFPHGSLPTVAQRLLPHSLQNNSLVSALIHPSFAEVQQPYGSPTAFVRPSAPFPYTNAWGCNVAILVPLLIAALITARSTARRVVIVALMAFAAVPAAETLNRGMFIAIGVALVWAAIIYALRGRSTPFVLLLAVGVAGFALASATGVLSTLNQRLQYSETNVGRLLIYREAWQGALQSPLFGNGAPKPSTTLDISVGTQGQLWNVMYSYGFVALAAFVGFFAYAALRSWRVGGPAGPWPHVTMVVTVLTFVYYGYDGVQLSVAMVGAAIALRAARIGSLTADETPQSAAPVPAQVRRAPAFPLAQ